MDYKTDQEWLEALDRLDQALTDLLAHQAQIASSLNETLDALARFTPENCEEVDAKLEVIAKYFEARRSVALGSRSVH